MSTKNSDDAGVVFRKDLGRYSVRSNGRDIACVLSTVMQKQRVQTVAVGDEVRIVHQGSDCATIVEVLPRRNSFSRRAVTTGRTALEQVIVSNVDQVVAVFAAVCPAPKWGLLDRYLVSAEAAGLPAVICITKIDLAHASQELETSLDEYRRIGYPVHKVSTISGDGLEPLARTLAGRTSVLVGKSGVGKSSLLNAFQPGQGARVGEVGHGRLGKGRHTTAHTEMFALECGGSLVDSPGTREFGLWDVEPADLALFFREMRPLLGKCRFGQGCRHDQEPGCAVRAAVVAGRISPYRYRSYLRLKESS